MSRGESPAYLGDQFLDRVRRSYVLAARPDATTLDSMWSEIGKIQGPVHDALASKDNHAIRRIFADPSATDLYFGVDFIRLTGRPPDDQPNEIEEWERKHEAMCRALVLQLAEAVGVRRWLPDDSELKPNYYPAEHIKDPDVDAVLSAVEAAIGFKFSFPNPFAREPGVETSRGLASFRALNAIYQAYRIRQELADTSNKSVLEIGPGIARTVYYSWLSRVRDYTTIDLPLGVAAQACFLGATLGPDAIWMVGDAPHLAVGRIRLLPSTFALPSAKFGLVVNADSITEMGDANSALYAAWIAEHAETFLSINHEANAPTIAALSRRYFSRSRARRYLYWLRRGWVEETFTFKHADLEAGRQSEVERERDALRDENLALRNSTSWKMTAPLRTLIGKIRKQPQRAADR